MGNITLKSFTMADRRSIRFHILGCKLAFTMAEILISLTIIGIIAAITLPSLQANINEKTWATQRKALYSRMSQAIGMMPSLNGYGVEFENGSINETATASKAAQAFITDGLSKVLKISNVCDGSSTENLKKCGFPEKITKMGINSKIDTPTTIRSLNYVFNYSGAYLNYSQLNTNAAAFETVNGESVLTYYNPSCSFVLGMNNSTKPGYNVQNLMQPTMCANFIYDLNGKKGPNRVGKDIGFMTAFYPTDSEIVMPYPVGQLQVTDDGHHPQFSIGYANQKCRKAYGQEARMANIEDLKSIFVNNKFGYMNSTFTNFLIGDGYTSSTLYSDNTVYMLSGTTGGIIVDSNPLSAYTTGSNRRNVFCVK